MNENGRIYSCFSSLFKFKKLISICYLVVNEKQKLVNHDKMNVSTSTL